MDINENVPKIDTQQHGGDGVPPQDLYTQQKMSIGYARVSTDEQDITTQIRLIMEKGVPERLIFIDEAVSGTKPPEKRNGWSQLLKFVKSGEVDKIYTYEVSRIGRTTSEAVKQILQLEEEYKVEIIFLSPVQKILNDCDPMFKPLYLTIMSLGADIERKLISERTKAGLQRVKENGSKSGKPIGRPEKVIDFQRIEDMHKKTGLSKNAVSKFLGYSPATYYRKVKEKKERESQKQPKIEQSSNT
jgi:DNA invertase Pin-like site-specific DNA recombinase